MEIIKKYTIIRGDQFLGKDSRFNPSYIYAAFYRDLEEAEAIASKYYGAEVRTYCAKMIIPGKWYRNPKMELHGMVKALYTRVKTSNFIYVNCHQIEFDMGLYKDGKIHNGCFSQSNSDYEKEMTEVTPEELKWIEKKLLYTKFGL
jgi:hypothetical protein